jgi:hypothetical protein
MEDQMNLKRVLKHKVVPYFFLQVLLNSCAILIAKSFNFGWPPEPPFFLNIMFPLMMALAYGFSYSFLARRKAMIAVSMLPTFFYFLFILMNSFESWELIYIFNRALNYLVCLIGLWGEERLNHEKIAQILFYVLLPFPYHFLLLNLAESLNKRMLLLSNKSNHSGL